MKVQFQAGADNTTHNCRQLPILELAHGTALEMGQSMKTRITLLLFLTFTSIAHAQFLEDKGLEAKLNHFQVDRNLGLGRLSAGVVVLNFKSQTAELGLRALKTKREIISLELDIINVQINPCGVIKVSAEQTTYDGLLQTLLVTDRSRSQCAEDRRQPQTEVELQTQNLRPRQSTRSFFRGLKFVPLKKGIKAL